MKILGDVLLYILIGTPAVVFFVLMPIVGIIDGWPWWASFTGWLFIPVFVLIVLFVAYVWMPIQVKIQEKYRTARAEWEREHREYE